MKTMYDIIIVGAGLTAATICALLKDRYKILVLETRDHIGGNCYDYVCNGTMIHRYGPHIFHSPNESVVTFLSKFTKWIPYKHKVSAELIDGTLVPFPYSKETEAALGGPLDQDSVIDIFFKPYSLKMWGKEWDMLPDTIKNRVPKNTNETSDYFVNQFVGFPEDGYTKMMERMFSGCDIILGVSPTYWMEHLGCGTIIYCGRPDLIMMPNNIKAGGIQGNWLTYRNLDFSFIPEPWNANTPVVNFCHTNTPFTRKTCFKNVLGGTCPIVTYEKPRDASIGDISPLYFYPSVENSHKHALVKDLVKKHYPNLILAGRLGTSTYIDMWQCVMMGAKLASDLS